jgi:response regulator RpfG family c-di-GMP phosphodiesterase/serine/threonine protein kinase
VRTFLDRLLQRSILESDAALLFLEERNDRLEEYDSVERLGKALAHAGLLTDYQLDRVLAGTHYGLVLGSYRVLDELGSGGMGKVFLAEHRLLKRRVAVKVLPVDDDCPSAVRSRFYAEMQVLAELHHPNIVLAFDAGELTPTEPGLPQLIYLVMELVEGGDLERCVREKGPRPIAQACEWIREAAMGLQAAHDQHLIHRDVKPSNILLTHNSVAKVVDFGLARQFCSRLTDPRALLGSVDFMPPEQSHDPSAVGREADVYGLGGTLFWLLTGEPPYPFQDNVGASLRLLQQEPPRRLRQLRPDAPEALDDLLAQMLDRDPTKRPTMPAAIAHQLNPFLGSRTLSAPLPCPLWRPERIDCMTVGRRVLIVDDDPPMRGVLRLILGNLGCNCVEAGDGETALTIATGESFALVLVDLGLPGMDGYELCRRLRYRTTNPLLKVIVVSGQGDADELSDSLPRGADDYLAKPFQPKQLTAKVRHAFRLLAAQERAGMMAERLLQGNRELQESLHSREQDIRQAHNALLFAMAKMVESREGETPGHVHRLQQYTHVLAQEASRLPSWFGLVDSRFLEQLKRCVPLHDIGKIGLPEDILLKPGALSESERRLVETHPLIGDRILEALDREHGDSLDFLGMTRAIVRHHHERWDGRGYPDGLAGEAIPPAARLVAVADVYDALRRRRLHKPALSHNRAMDVMLDQSPGQFDPALVVALKARHTALEQIYRDLLD